MKISYGLTTPPYGVERVSPLGSHTFFVIVTEGDFICACIEYEYVLDMIRLNSLKYIDYKYLVRCLECIRYIATCTSKTVYTEQDWIYNIFKDEEYTEYYRFNPVSYKELLAGNKVTEYFILFAFKLFPLSKIDEDSKLWLFHIGRNKLEISDIDMNYHGTENGNGFYTAFDEYLIYDHKIRNGIVSIYKLDILEACKHLRFWVGGFGYFINNRACYDIIANNGLKWTSKHGGQVTFKSFDSLKYLEFMDSYPKDEFMNLRKEGYFKDKITLQRSYDV